MAKNPDDPLALIRKRKAEMAAAAAKERAERERMDAARAKEAEELAIAEKVLARLAAGNEAPPKEKIDVTKPLGNGKIPTTDGTPRPKGIPTVAEMVTELLLIAEKKGKRGLTRNEIMAGIDARWWPGVAVNMVIPTMYKSISKGYWFTKEGDLFMRLRGGQPPKRPRADQLKFEN
jgi:hypothetical protein